MMNSGDSITTVELSLTCNVCGNHWPWMLSVTNKQLYWLWTRDGIRHHRSESTLAQVMACFWMAPNHYTSQCWLIICKVLRAISQEMLQISILGMILKMANFRLESHLPGANGLIDNVCGCHWSLIKSVTNNSLIASRGDFNSLYAKLVWVYINLQ